MKLTKKLSTKYFILSQIVLLIIGLASIAGMHYVLNIQYNKEDKPFLYGPVTTLPKSLLLNLDQPDDNSLFFQSSMLISGKTGPLKEVLILTNSEDLVVTSKKDGSFSTDINLDEGENRIMVVVFDNDGDSKSVERTVYYSKEKL